MTKAPPSTVSDDDIRTVLDAHQLRLFALPHVNGVGIVDSEQSNIGRAIAIYVDLFEKTDGLPAKLKSKVGGKTLTIPTEVRLRGMPDLVATIPSPKS